MAKPDSKYDFGAIPAEKRNLPSYTEITYKTKKAPPGAKKILDSERGYPTNLVYLHKLNYIVALQSKQYALQQDQDQVS